VPLLPTWLLNQPPSRHLLLLLLLLLLCSFYVTPQCAQSRAALLTGRYPPRVGKRAELALFKHSNVNALHQLEASLCFAGSWMHIILPCIAFETINSLLAVSCQDLQCCGDTNCMHDLAMCNATHVAMLLLAGTMLVHGGEAEQQQQQQHLSCSICYSFVW
jgi:hypothetical protein